MKRVNRKTCLMLGLMALVIAENSFAGTGGDEFSDVWTTIKDWTQGTLGRVVAGSMILVGIISGVARQSLMAFAIGIGGGIGLQIKGDAALLCYTEKGKGEKHFYLHPFP